MPCPVITSITEMRTSFYHRLVLSVFEQNINEITYMNSFFVSAKYHYVIVYELNIPQFILQMSGPLGWGYSE